MDHLARFDLKMAVRGYDGGRSGSVMVEIFPMNCSIYSPRELAIITEKVIRSAYIFRRNSLSNDSAVKVRKEPLDVCYSFSQRKIHAEEMITASICTRGSLFFMQKEKPTMTTVRKLRRLNGNTQSPIYSFLGNHSHSIANAACNCLYWVSTRGKVRRRKKNVKKVTLES